MKLSRLALVLAPLAVLAALVGIFAANLNRDPGYIASVLIDKPAPEFTLLPVKGLGVPGLDTDMLKGQVSVVNVFASWCIPCRAEHPLLSRLKAETGVRLFGINNKDAAENALAFLGELGNPYDAVGADETNRVSIDWGVYGVPETFVVDARGTIVFKHIGPLSEQALETELKPAIEKARGESISPFR